jgi:hypothetical protein
MPGMVKLELELHPEDRVALSSMLRQSFPDAEIDEQTLLALLLTAYLDDTSEISIDWDRYRDALDGYVAQWGLVMTPGSESPRVLAPVGERGPLRYYRAHATHDREIPDYDPFTGHLGMVRVTLPAKEPKSWMTAVGEIVPADHLLVSVAEVERKYGAHIDGTIERVDLITPARLHGARFAAISVYLGYTAGHTTPTFYILEAGLATGQSKALYFAPRIDFRILSYSGYRPTPFSDSDHVYTARLTLVGDNPLLLQIHAHRDAGSRPYVRITTLFEETTRPDPTWPGQQLVRATKIVARRMIAGVRRGEG